MISKKHFLYGAVTGLVLLFAFVFSLPDGNLHIVFCDVGQGDAIYIRTPSGQDLLIDGGPNDQVLTCLGKYMPFYDRTIDAVVLTHPQSDHMKGLTSVISRYKVKNFIKLPIDNGAKEIKDLDEIIKSRQIALKPLYGNDNFNLGTVKFDVLWPEKKYVLDHAQEKNIVLSNKEESRVLGVSASYDVNEFSYYLHLTYGIFDVLFTGDGDSLMQPFITKNLKDIEVVKVPHHGSRKSLLDKFIDQIKPGLAVISVGKNSYGHPSENVMKLLSDRAIKVLRTDREGDIEVVSDGKKWWVK